MSRDPSTAESDANPDVDALIVATDWLSGVFIAPLSQQQITSANAVTAQDALRWTGLQLNATDTTETLCRLLTQEHLENLSAHLQRRYTALFEGIFRDRAVMPYESAWHDQDRSTLGGVPVADMNAILRDLDMHIRTDCCEPSDHLAIELAALATALRSDNHLIAVSLVRRLERWTPDFAEALEQRDSDGFYAAAGQLLLALIRKAAVVLMATEQLKAPVNEYKEGEFA